MVERCRVWGFLFGGNHGLAEALEVVIGDLDRIERARQMVLYSKLNRASCDWPRRSLPAGSCLCFFPLRY